MKSQVSFNSSTLLLFVKILIILFLIVSPFINYTWLMFLDSTYAKMLCILCIVVVCFIDFQLALIATMAFLIVIIRLNQVSLGKLRHVDAFVNQEIDVGSFFKPPIDVASHEKQKQRQDHQSTQSCGSQSNVTTEEMNNKLVDMFIDEKIKPYSVFIDMMTSDDNIAKAQGFVM